MKLLILLISFSTVLTQELTCPTPPDNCTLPCPIGECCTCQNPCPATCNNTNPTPCPTFQCNASCHQVCPNEQVFNQMGGYCIPQDICGPNEADECCTRPNEVYYECRQCTGTCRVLWPNCTLEICGKPAGCDCKPGLVRDEKTGICVNPDSPSCKEQRSTQCGPREVLAQCASAKCQERPCDGTFFLCAQFCYPPGYGICVCKEGLDRDTKTGLCVDPNEPSCKEQRGVQCDLNEVIAQCASAQCDEPSCDNSSMVCPQICVEPPLGFCVCKEGFYRDKNTGKCVTPDMCSPVCQADEEYYPCDPLFCQRTCQAPNSICKDRCITPGICDCKKGLVRDYNTGTCVNPDSPSCEAQRVKCGPDEALNICGFCCDYGCREQNCDNTTYPCGCPQGGCPCAPPSPTCLCKEGLYRDKKTGLCVDPNEKSCRDQRNGSYYCADPDDQFYPCATKHCFPSCKDPNPICPEICFIPGNCHCKEGLVRNTETHTCVTPDDPSCLAQRTPECDDDEQYYNCSTANCQRTCKEPNPYCATETNPVCITPGNCDCKVGLVRDTKNGQCCHPNKKSCRKQRIKH